MKDVASLAVGDWVLYEWEKTERIGRIAETGDPLTILHPGGDEDLAEEIAVARVTAEWIPEGNPEAGNGERAESVGVSED